MCYKGVREGRTSWSVKRRISFFLTVKSNERHFINFEYKNSDITTIKNEHCTVVTPRWWSVPGVPGAEVGSVGHGPASRKPPRCLSASWPAEECLCHILSHSTPDCPKIPSAVQEDTVRFSDCWDCNKKHAKKKFAERQVASRWSSESWKECGEDALGPYMCWWRRRRWGTGDGSGDVLDSGAAPADAPLPPPEYNRARQTTNIRQLPGSKFSKVGLYLM